MKKALFCIPLLLMLLLGSTNAIARDYSMVEPPELKKMLDADVQLHILDIQVSEEYQRHHLKNSLATAAYPVKSAEDLRRLKAHLPDLNADGAPIVIVCPRGKGGAKRTYDYFLEQGIAEGRLKILSGGQQGWPYPEYLAGVSGD